MYPLLDQHRHQDLLIPLRSPLAPEATPAAPSNPMDSVPLISEASHWHLSGCSRSHVNHRFSVMPTFRQVFTQAFHLLQPAQKIISLPCYTQCFTTNPIHTLMQGFAISGGAISAFTLLPSH